MSCVFSSRLPESLDKEDSQLYFQTADMAECLAGPGYNAERLSIPYVPQVTGTTVQPPLGRGTSCFYFFLSKKTAALITFFFLPSLVDSNLFNLIPVEQPFVLFHGFSDTRDAF